MEDDEPIRFMFFTVMMRKVMKCLRPCRAQSVESEMTCAGMHWRVQSPSKGGKDLVLDHIILDMTGDSVPLEQITDESVQRAFRRKKRLLRRSNTVLVSRLAIMVSMCFAISDVDLVPNPLPCSASLSGPCDRLSYGKILAQPQRWG